MPRKIVVIEKHTHTDRVVTKKVPVYIERSHEVSSSSSDSSWGMDEATFAIFIWFIFFGAAFLIGFLNYEKTWGWWTTWVTPFVFVWASACMIAGPKQ